MPEELIKAAREWGGSGVELIHNHDEAFLPAFVRLPFMMATLAILKGKKS